ncbi:hypothetical protein MKW94_006059, partial [Papaver nudicaule]|nr:hypothetical protein [Papaver nudicaule]
MAPKRKRVSKSSSTTNDQELSSTSKWIYETVKGSHEFKVEGYSLAKRMGIGAKMTSEKFRVGGYKWVIVFCPNGHDEASEEYISVHLKLVSPGEVMVLISIILLDQSGKGIHHQGRSQ